MEWLQPCSKHPGYQWVNWVDIKVNDPFTPQKGLSFTYISYMYPVFFKFFTIPWPIYHQTCTVKLGATHIQKLRWFSPPQRLSPPSSWQRWDPHHDPLDSPHRGSHREPHLTTTAMGLNQREVFTPKLAQHTLFKRITNMKTQNSTSTLGMGQIPRYPGEHQKSWGLWWYAICMYNLKCVDLYPVISINLDILFYFIFLKSLAIWG